MDNKIEIFHLYSIPRDELLAYAIKMVKAYAQAAKLTHEKMLWIIRNMLDERGHLIEEKFYLFWWERRHFFFQLYLLRFYKFQTTAIPKGKVILTFKEYAQETGDYFSKEIYRERLPSITSEIWHNLNQLVQHDLEQISAN